MFLPALPAVGTGGLTPAHSRRGQLEAEVSFPGSIASLSLLRACQAFPSARGAVGPQASRRVLGLCTYLSCTIVKPGLFLAPSVTSECLSMGKIAYSTLTGF